MSTQEHWNKVYSRNEINELGWFEQSPRPSLELINKCGVDKDAVILDIGSGASILIEKLIGECYRNIAAVDISEVALAKARGLCKHAEDARETGWICNHRCFFARWRQKMQRSRCQELQSRDDRRNCLAMSSNCWNTWSTSIPNLPEGSGRLSIPGFSVRVE